MFILKSITLDFEIYNQENALCIRTTAFMSHRLHGCPALRYDMNQTGILNCLKIPSNLFITVIFSKILTRHSIPHPHGLDMESQIAKFMGPTWGPPGSCRPRWAPSWPHEPCYQGCLCEFKMWPSSNTCHCESPTKYIMEKRPCYKVWPYFHLCVSKSLL